MSGAVIDNHAHRSQLPTIPALCPSLQRKESSPARHLLVFAYEHVNRRDPRQTYCGVDRLSGDTLESVFPMPYRRLAANELGAFLGAIAQPRRIQIIEELRGGEKDVGTLASTLELAHSNVSQHLAVLRTLRVVSEHREGRRIVYQLCFPHLAEWLVEGMRFLPAMAQDNDQVKSALQSALAVWSRPKNSKRNEG